MDVFNRIVQSLQPENLKRKTQEKLPAEFDREEWVMKAESAGLSPTEKEKLTELRKKVDDLLLNGAEW